jgi:hypothetical protein
MVAKTYWFDVVKPVDNVLHHHTEAAQFENQGQAFRHFQKLLLQCRTGGYYYLSGWGEGTWEEHLRKQPPPVIGDD